MADTLGGHHWLIFVNIWSCYTESCRLVAVIYVAVHITRHDQHKYHHSVLSVIIHISSFFCHFSVHSFMFILSRIIIAKGHINSSAAVANI